MPDRGGTSAIWWAALLLPVETIAYVARLQRESLPRLSVAIRVRWQATALFLTHVDISAPANSRAASQSAGVERVEKLDPAPQTFAFHAKASQTLFPLSRNEPLPQAH